MEARHFINTLCKQKVKTFFLSSLITLNFKWVPRFIEHLRWLLLYCLQRHILRHIFLDTYLMYKKWNSFVYKFVVNCRVF